MTAEIPIQFSVNGESRSVTSDPTRPLLEVLREDLQITGPKYGCGEAQCGACSVLLEGRRVFSCRTPVSTAQGKTILTIEGLEKNGALHPVQQAFLDEGAFQCGYCTAGMIMAAVSLLDEKPKPSDPEIREAMNHNLCRCGIYVKILHAVRVAANAKGGAQNEVVIE